MKVQPRRSWNARSPQSMSGQLARNIREFFLHYPASPHDLDFLDTDMEHDAYMRGIQNFHMDVRRWSDFAYNFAVFQDGAVYKGRGLNRVPAAQLGHNTNTIAVLCVVGNSETPSHAMRQSLRDLKNMCDKRCGRDLFARPHSAVTPTACPGNRIRGIINDLNAQA